MEVIHIRHQGILDGQPTFLVSAVSLQTPQGLKKLIPHPFGQEAASFTSLQEAVDAIHRAGYDAECDGMTYSKSKTGNLKTNSTGRISKGASLEDFLTRVIPDLKAQLQDKSPGVVSSAAFALGEIGTEEAIAALIDCFSHEDATSRKNASEALAKIGKPALKALRQSLHHGHWLVRHTGLTALCELAGRQPVLLSSCLEEVIPLLKDENWLVRSQAAQVFAEVARILRQRQESNAPSAI